MSSSILVLLSTLISLTLGFYINEPVSRARSSQIVRKSQLSDEEAFAEVQARIDEIIYSGRIDDRNEDELRNNIGAVTADVSRRGNRAAALASSLLAGGLFFFQHSVEPVSGVALLHAMEKDSAPLVASVCSKKPTVIDFYADWCTSCKEMAPTMRFMERKYANELNFVTIDGSNPRNADLVDRFRVDGIPHVALVTPKAEIVTSLVGAVPKSVLEGDLRALIQGEEMPFVGYDPFPDSGVGPASRTLFCAKADQ
jgi:thiol-disulfide isomerase/thioredoxin